MRHPVRVEDSSSLLASVYARLADAAASSAYPRARKKKKKTLLFMNTSRPPAHSWAGVVHSQLSPAQPSPAQNVRFLMLKIHTINQEIAMREGGGIELCIEILG